MRRTGSSASTTTTLNRTGSSTVKKPVPPPQLKKTKSIASPATTPSGAPHSKTASSTATTPNVTTSSNPKQPAPRKPVAAPQQRRQSGASNLTTMPSSSSKGGHSTGSTGGVPVSGPRISSANTIRSTPSSASSSTTVALAKAPGGGGVAISPPGVGVLQGGPSSASDRFILAAKTILQEGTVVVSDEDECMSMNNNIREGEKDQGNSSSKFPLSTTTAGSSEEIDGGAGVITLALGKSGVEAQKKDDGPGVVGQTSIRQNTTGLRCTTGIASDGGARTLTVALQPSPSVELVRWTSSLTAADGDEETLTVGCSPTVGGASRVGEEAVTQLLRANGGAADTSTAKHASGAETIATVVNGSSSASSSAGSVSVSLGGDLKLTGTRTTLKNESGGSHSTTLFPLAGEVAGALSAGQQGGVVKVTGQWTRGARAGQGTVKTGGNQNFEGAWLDDRRHGPGVLTFAATLIPSHPTAAAEGNSGGTSATTFTAQATGSWSLGRLSGCPQISFLNNESALPGPSPLFYSSSADGSAVKLKMEMGVFSGSWSENPRELFGTTPLNVKVLGKENSAVPLQQLAAAACRLKAVGAAAHLQHRLKLSAGISGGSTTTTLQLGQLGDLMTRQQQLERLGKQLRHRASQVAELAEEAKRLGLSKKRLQSRLQSGEEQMRKAEANVKTFKDQLDKDAVTRGKVEADVSKEENNQEALMKYMEAKKNSPSTGGASSSNPLSNEEELAQLQTGISKLQSGLRDISNDIRNLKTKKESLSRDIPGLEEDVSATSAHLEKCEEAMASAAEKAESQRLQYEKLVDQSRDGSNEALTVVDELVLQVEKLALEYEALKEVIQAASGKKEDRLSQQNHLKAEIINLGLQVDDIKVSIEAVQDEVLSSGATLEAALTGHVTVEAELAASQHQTQTAKDRLKLTQKEEDEMKSELHDLNNESRKGYQNPETLKEKYEKSVANFNARIAAILQNSTPPVESLEASRTPTPPPKADVEEEEMKALQEQVNVALQQTDESYTEKRQLQRRLETAAQNSTKYREKIKRLEDKLEKESQQKDKESAFTGTSDDLKRLLKETKRDNEDANVGLVDLRSLVALKQADLDRLLADQAANNNRVPGGRGSSSSGGDQRIKVLQQEVDRRDAVISAMRMKVKRVHTLESKLLTAKDQALALSQSRDVRKQSGLRRQSNATAGW